MMCALHEAACPAARAMVSSPARAPNDMRQGDGGEDTPVRPGACGAEDGGVDGLGRQMNRDVERAIGLEDSARHRFS